MSDTKNTPVKPEFDLHSPGHRMETYDPEWKQHCKAVRVLLDRLTRDDPWCENHAYRSQLTNDLCNAHMAQFQYTWQYDADLRDRYAGTWQPPELAHLRIPSPPHFATPDDINQHYKKWAGICRDLRSYLLKSPVKEWGNGAFAQEMPQGVERVVFEDQIATGGTLPIAAKFVVETHADAIHVCAIQGPGPTVSIMNQESAAIDWVAARYLPRRRVFNRFQQKPQQRLFFYYTFAPTDTRPPVQHVWGYELTRARWGHDVLKRKVDTSGATPILRDEGYKLRPELWGEIEKLRARAEKKIASGSA